MISPRRVLWIAANTIREAVRNRVLYTLLFFAVLLIGTGVLLSTLSYVERERILQDVGFAAIRIFGVLIAIFVGVGLIHKEVERRTIFTILSKPVSRSEFLLGKYAGLVATVWLQLAVMGVAFAAVSLAAGAPLDGRHAVTLLLYGVELAVVVGIATFFSSFTTPLLASLFTGGLYFVGLITQDLRALGAQSHALAVQRFTEVLYQVLPDFSRFDFSLRAVHGLPISSGEVAIACLYAIAYAVVVLTAAVAVFARRDLR